MNYQGKEGGKTRRTKPNQTKTVLIGKIYANWCPHCMTLKPEWSKMKKSIRNKLGKMNNIKVQFVEIEQGQEEDKVGRINRVYLRNSDKKLAVQQGYPTIFRISGGQVDYFEGGRNAQEMEAFYLKENGKQFGGEGQQESGKKGGDWFSSFFSAKETIPEKQQQGQQQQPLLEKGGQMQGLPKEEQQQQQKEDPQTGMFSKLGRFFGFGKTEKRQEQQPNNQVGGKRRKNKTRKQKKT
jgi:thiol-disulfide isomerase/thioredoxin